MTSILHRLFNELGYNKENGLFILDEDEEKILNVFPSRVSRIITEVIKPYAIFCADIQYENKEHIKPFNNPLILFYDNPTESEYSLIPKHSFNLSRAPLVIINKENNIEIYNGFDFSDSSNQWLELINVNRNLLYIENLRNGEGWREIYNEYFTKSKTVDRFLLSNITDARRILIAKEINFPEGNLTPEVANRLIGRLIFIRYLIDRNVVFNDQNILIGSTKKERQEALNQILLNHKQTYDFFEYISNKFGGDLFPLEFENQGLPFFEKDYVKQENLNILYHLLTSSKMFMGDKVKGYSVQPSMFNVYDFEIIPVELISNIYESFLGNTAFSNGKMITELSKQKEVKAYYTPPFLVDYVLSQTIQPFLKKQQNSNCKVLDPSCGSGIFLVESLRRIIDKEIVVNSKENKYKKTISNEKLWRLLEDNIYGIDIDKNAIEITIFSLYITLLDYKTHPKEIENFEFRPLKDKNLFGGQKADFFNESNAFNTLFKKQVKLDFIVGNPPWGIVKTSRYVDYITERNRKELSRNLKEEISLSIGNKEISQAFIVRVSDLIQKEHKTKICFIVTGKNLYNSDESAIKWRKYFLSKFNVHQCFDLFGVNNKVAGGKQIFDNANQPPAILLYSLKDNSIANNKIKHIVARANKYYYYFKTIVIEKNDVKLIDQNLFIKDDKLWKIMLYGNILDYLFIKKLKDNDLTISKIISKFNLTIKGGFKSKDSGIPVNKRKSTKEYWKYDYIEVEKSKDLRQFQVISNKTFKQKLDELYLKGDIQKDLKVPQITEISAFKGKKLLIKKGLDKYLNHRAVSAFYDGDCIFSSTIASIVPVDGEMSNEVENLLLCMSAIFNSKLFTYFLLMTSSSFGADRNRVNFIEFLEMPFKEDIELSLLTRELHDLKKDDFFNENREKIYSIENQIEYKIYELFNINSIEKELINYALNISIPVMKRADRLNSNHLSIFEKITEKNLESIGKYCQTFINHFSSRFNKTNKCFIVDVYINKNFIAVNFVVSEEVRKDIIKYFFNSSLEDSINKIGGLGMHKVSTCLFAQQDIRGFNRSSFYVIKPNILKNWHRAIAHLDLSEFIEAIAKSEIKKTN
ncbi:hypothetical protein APS56_02745 [Pseudalgibacter alginicilyticus]|uniref:site-specific DNA-methyltransferase (adenine-specific) n=1 Tax=Pseudalgibacter alginicilyticus TaxID=1736674 RepID=A0A0N7HY33_9FLAO|nr:MULTISPECIES: DNA methyltransferase [Flavobacteriaceae]ALJ04134.1 hypothetical protein APS56_02745 [Pseudalgibacter alginicilyticus]